MSSKKYIGATLVLIAIIGTAYAAVNIFGYGQIVRAVLGKETLQTPSYILIWVLAIAIVSGLIIELTKLKPGWFRAFMAGTYTTLPLVVNYYGKNTWISFAVIAIQTTILTALWFKQWKETVLIPRMSKEWAEKKPG